jgi:hypothetical protein
MDNSYPRWKFHKEIQPDGIIVLTHEKFIALGEGWVESPSDFDKPLESKKKDLVEAAPALDKTPAEVEKKKLSKRRGKS